MSEAPILAAVPGTGRGLLGLRERIAVSGGQLDAARQPGGGWRILARISVDMLTATAAGQ